MAQNLTLSGTVSCPACRPGTFQPGLLDRCLCLGYYKFKAQSYCDIASSPCNANVKLMEIRLIPCNCDQVTPSSTNDNEPGSRCSKPRTASVRSH
jgi:hypothetical protein